MIFESSLMRGGVTGVSRLLSLKPSGGGISMLLGAVRLEAGVRE